VAASACHVFLLSERSTEGFFFFVEVQDPFSAHYGWRSVAVSIARLVSSGNRGPIRYVLLSPCPSKAEFSPTSFLSPSLTAVDLFPSSPLSPGVPFKDIGTPLGHGPLVFLPFTPLHIPFFSFADSFLFQLWRKGGPGNMWILFAASAV